MSDGDLPPAGPATLRDGRVVVALRPRERLLEARDAASGRRLGAVAVGTGPTNVVTDGRNLAYVTDTAGDGLLVVRLRPSLEVTRRMHVPGGPYALAIDPERNRLWITATATNELVEAAAGRRPRTLARYPTVRQPDAVRVDVATGRVTVRARNGRRRSYDAPG